jgi:hypothetical protein
MQKLILSHEYVHPLDGGTIYIHQEEVRGFNMLFLTSTPKVPQFTYISVAVQEGENVETKAAQLLASFLKRVEEGYRYCYH